VVPPRLGRRIAPEADLTHAETGTIAENASAHGQSSDPFSLDNGGDSGKAYLLPFGLQLPGPFGACLAPALQQNSPLSEAWQWHLLVRFNAFNGQYSVVAGI
jgi:hypothetical protein